MFCDSPVAILLFLSARCSTKGKETSNSIKQPLVVSSNLLQHRRILIQLHKPPQFACQCMSSFIADSGLFQLAPLRSSMPFRGCFEWVLGLRLFCYGECRNFQS